MVLGLCANRHSVLPTPPSYNTIPRPLTPNCYHHKTLLYIALGWFILLKVCASRPFLSLGSDFPRTLTMKRVRKAIRSRQTAPSKVSTSKDADESKQRLGPAASLPTAVHCTPIEDHGVNNSISNDDKQSSVAGSNIIATQDQLPGDPVHTTPVLEASSTGQSSQKSEVKSPSHPVSAGMTYACKSLLNRCHEGAAVQDFRITWWTEWRCQRV